MNAISEFFASFGINPFLAGFVLGIVLCAIARVGLAKPSAFKDGLLSEHDRVAISELSLSPNVSTAILESLRQGNKIEAIRVLRKSSGLGLADAKRLVEAIDWSQTSQDSSAQFRGLDARRFQETGR